MDFLPGVALDDCASVPLLSSLRVVSWGVPVSLDDSVLFCGVCFFLSFFVLFLGFSDDPDGGLFFP